ncbi:MAG: murein transglycosylase A [Deltaproteobacteria bacterium]|nr:murein transglycosylase A [Deltaproteobacteria bacterium]
MRGIDISVAVLGAVVFAAGLARAQPAPCVEEEKEPPPPKHDQLKLTKVKFADLPGWADDRHAEAVPSFLRSCEVLAKLKDDAAVGHDGHGGKARHWRKACAAATKLKAGDHAAAKAMFEAEFVPHQAAGKNGPEGKLTGYFVQELRASRKKGGKYQYPIHDRPKDLVMVDLSKHIPDAHGRRIWGRLDPKGDIVPFYTRPEIRKGSLDGKGLEIMYADDPVDVLFAHIEGSAKAVMDDGSSVWLEFSGKNGRAYRGVGGVLKSMGQLTAPGSGTMQGIRQWFKDNPGKFDEVVDQSHSYVFFHESKQPGAVGSQMVVLTAERSMAIDRAFIAQSTPIWVETRAPVVGKPGSAPWRQLLIAQDTGGGILGAVRGDIYWGDDTAAADRGGRMGGAGKYWLLLPRGVTK